MAKRNGYFLLLCIVTITIVAEFAGIFIMLKATRFLPEQKIVLNVSAVEGENTFSISDKSISDLEKVITENDKLPDITEINNIFDKEKSFYITLITVLSVLLAIFGIVPVITALLEKNEIAQLKGDLEKLRTEYSYWIKNEKQKQILENLKADTNQLQQNYNLILPSNLLVTNVQQFESYLIETCSSNFKTINSKYFKDEHMFQTFALCLHNFINAAVLYAGGRFQYPAPLSFPQITSIVIDISQNSIAKTIFIQMKALLPTELYVKLKKYYTNFPKNNIVFGDF